MFFHWLKLYGKRARGATAVIDSIFQRAQAMSPAVYAQNSFDDAARKAKFEYMCPWLAQELAHADPRTARTVLEAMIDRIEVGLREASVGDMKVGREVRTYAAALNGRMQRYIPLIKAEQWQELAVALTEHGVEASVADAIQAHGVKKAA